MPQQMAFHGLVCCLHRCQIVIRLWYSILNSLPTCHKHNCLMGYINIIMCNTGGPGFNSTLKWFSHNYIYVTFSVLKNSNFSFLTCYIHACGYIKEGLDS